MTLEEESGWGENAALLPSSLLCTAGLRDTASLTARKFEFNPKWGIDNPVLSLAEDFDPSGNPLALGNHSLSQEIPQLLRPSISLVTTPLCLPLITALVGSNCVEEGGRWLLSSVQATLPTWYLVLPSNT